MRRRRRRLLRLAFANGDDDDAPPLLAGRRRRGSVAAPSPLHRRRRPPPPPAEVLLETFAFLARDDLDTLALVSRRFRALIWTRFCVADDDDAGGSGGGPWRVLGAVRLHYPNAGERFEIVDVGAAHTSPPRVKAAAAAGFDALRALLATRWVRAQNTLLTVDAERLVAESEAAAAAMGRQQQQRSSASPTPQRAASSSLVTRSSRWLERHRHRQRRKGAELTLADLACLAHLWSGRRLIVNVAHFSGVAAQLTRALDTLLTLSACDSLCLSASCVVDESAPIELALEPLARRCRKLDLYYNEFSLSAEATVAFLETPTPSLERRPNRRLAARNNDEANGEPRKTAAGRWLVRGCKYVHSKQPPNIDAVVELAKRRFLAATTPCVDGYGLLVRCAPGSAAPFELTNARTHERLILYYPTASQVVLYRCAAGIAAASAAVSPK